MSVGLPQIRVGDPLRHEALSIFPLFSKATAQVDYCLPDAALANESLLIEEVNEHGSVPDLVVENKGDVGGNTSLDILDQVAHTLHQSCGER